MPDFQSGGEGSSPSTRTKTPTMSILNVHDIEWDAHNSVLIKTLEGRQELMKEEFKDFLNQFRGRPIDEYILNEFRWGMDKFIEHVASKYAFNCKLYNLMINKSGIVPVITGTFEYATPMSLVYKPVHFSIA